MNNKKAYVLVQVLYYTGAFRNKDPKTEEKLPIFILQGEWTVKEKCDRTQRIRSNVINWGGKPRKTCLFRFFLASLWSIPSSWDGAGFLWNEGLMTYN
jgi:hypothetical protein